jgi:hypothetical protein
MHRRHRRSAAASRGSRHRQPKAERLPSGSYKESENGVDRSIDQNAGSGGSRSPKAVQEDSGQNVHGHRTSRRPWAFVVEDRRLAIRACTHQRLCARGAEPAIGDKGLVGREPGACIHSGAPAVALLPIARTLQVSSVDSRSATGCYPLLTRSGTLGTKVGSTPKSGVALAHAHCSDRRRCDPDRAHVPLGIHDLRGNLRPARGRLHRDGIDDARPTGP